MCSVVTPLSNTKGARWRFSVCSLNSLATKAQVFLIASTSCLMEVVLRLDLLFSVGVFGAALAAAWVRSRPDLFRPHSSLGHITRRKRKVELACVLVADGDLSILKRRKCENQGVVSMLEAKVARDAASSSGSGSVGEEHYSDLAPLINSPSILSLPSSHTANPQTLRRRRQRMNARELKKCCAVI